MAARRAAAKACSPAHNSAPEPFYRIDELRGLVGGKGSKTANRDLSADVKQLKELGLVSITDHEITFATSIEQIAFTGELDGFWSFFGALPRPKGKIPIPRRTLRALAAGFRPAETAYIVAALMRSVYWHKKTADYRTDGRTKCSWIAETFGFDLGTVRAARRNLIELGWLKPQESPQWALNKWGPHDIVNVDWAPAKPSDASNEIVENADTKAVGEGRSSGESHTPQPKKSGESHTPYKQDSPSTKDLNTRRLRAKAPNPTGVCIQESEGRKPERKRRRPRPKSPEEPNIREITSEDLKDPKALLKLREQAVALGFAFDGESGKLDFLALANRARSNGANPPALFFNLVSKHRKAFITIADEETARNQLRELRDGPTTRSSGGGGEGIFGQTVPDYTEDEALVLRCQKQCPTLSPKKLFRAARGHLPEGWNLDRWMGAHLSLRQKDAQRWAGAEDDCLPANGFGVGAGW